MQQSQCSDNTQNQNGQDNDQLQQDLKIEKIRRQILDTLLQILEEIYKQKIQKHLGRIFYWRIHYFMIQFSNNYSIRPDDHETQIQDWKQIQEIVVRIQEQFMEKLVRQNFFKQNGQNRPFANTFISIFNDLVKLCEELKNSKISKNIKMDYCNFQFEEEMLNIYRYIENLDRLYDEANDNFIMFNTSIPKEQTDQLTDELAFIVYFIQHEQYGENTNQFENIYQKISRIYANLFGLENQKNVFYHNTKAKIQSYLDPQDQQFVLPGQLSDFMSFIFTLPSELEYIISQQIDVNQEQQISTKQTLELQIVKSKFNTLYPTNHKFVFDYLGLKEDSEIKINAKKGENVIRFGRQTSQFPAQIQFDPRDSFVSRNQFIIDCNSRKGFSLICTSWTNPTEIIMTKQQPIKPGFIFQVGDLTAFYVEQVTQQKKQQAQAKQEENRTLDIKQIEEQIMVCQRKSKVKKQQYQQQYTTQPNNNSNNNGSCNQINSLQTQENNFLSEQDQLTTDIQKAGDILQGRKQPSKSNLQQSYCSQQQHLQQQQQQSGINNFVYDDQEYFLTIGIEWSKLYTSCKKSNNQNQQEFTFSSLEIQQTENKMFTIGKDPQCDIVLSEPQHTDSKQKNMIDQIHDFNIKIQYIQGEWVINRMAETQLNVSYSLKSIEQKDNQLNSQPFIFKDHINEQIQIKVGENIFAAQLRQ